MNTPLVSIVVPTYNRAYCLAKTIDSALSQTYHNLEILLIDDGSTDETSALIQQNYAHDSRIRYAYQENSGVSSARNHGFRLARGEFIALLDSDDLWEPWKLELQVAILIRFPEIGMVWTEMAAVNPEDKLISTKYLRTMYSAYQWYPTAAHLFRDSYAIAEIEPRFSQKFPTEKVYWGDIFSPMMMGNLVHTSTVLLRRNRLEKVREFREDFRFAGEDFDFHLRTCREGLVAYADVSSIIYQVGRADQITVKFEKDSALNFLKTIEPVLWQDADRITVSQRMIHQMLASAYATLGEKLLDLGENAEASKAILTSLQHKFLQPRMFGLFLLSLLPHSFDSRVRNAYRVSKKASRLQLPFASKNIFHRDKI
jgi:glycosyltransferase involved in cell wall biosynthesis